eukprot:TRINITY_DN17907_c2_g1_i1.p1 TRINITY_DN17907_c2_g1~~TRINITY_DN17907_c2_g1_i1.p1  ORF type:complete len:170 (-),score=40.43 TRINITY_DN17907_c2_g1_i1:155-622(-)
MVRHPTLRFFFCNSCLNFSASLKGVSSSSEEDSIVAESGSSSDSAVGLVARGGVDSTSRDLGLRKESWRVDFVVGGGGFSSKGGRVLGSNFSWDCWGFGFAWSIWTTTSSIGFCLCVGLYIFPGRGKENGEIEEECCSSAALFLPSHLPLFFLVV